MKHFIHGPLVLAAIVTARAVVNSPSLTERPEISANDPRDAQGGFHALPFLPSKVASRLSPNRMSKVTSTWPPILYDIEDSGILYNVNTSEITSDDEVQMLLDVQMPRQENSTSDAGTLAARSGPCIEAKNVVKESRYPYNVIGKIGSRLKGTCSGALVGPDLVLTALHCIPC